MNTIYKGVQFKTELEAIWAAFFDLAGWEWRMSPAAIGNWKPDFRVTFGCDHSECSGSHTILVSVLPVRSLDNLSGHPALSYKYGIPNTDVDGGAIFGCRPAATQWEIVHGSGGGVEDVYFRVDNANDLWERAISMVPVLTHPINY